MMRWLSMMCLALLLAIPLANAQTYPKLTGRVVDQADIIPPQEEIAINDQLQAIEKQTGHQFVVATVKDLEGYDVADYGIGLGRQWGIGKKGKDDGVVLLVAPNERRVYIAVGYGLNPVMTDIHAGRIIRNDITPRFKAGDFPGGIQSGVNAIAQQIQLTPEEAVAQAAAIEAEERNRADDGDIGGLVFVGFIIFFFFILPMLSRMGRDKKRRRGGPWDAPIIIWGGGDWGGGGGGSSWGGGDWGGGGGGFGGFSGGGGSFGGGGASGGW